MKVTDDAYEFPVAMADTARELARIVGVSPFTISSSILRYESGERSKSLYRRIEIEEEDE